MKQIITIVLLLLVAITWYWSASTQKDDGSFDITNKATMPFVWSFALLTIWGLILIFI